MALVPLEEKTSRSLFPFPLSTKCSYSKKLAIYKPGRGPSSEPGHDGILIIDFPTSRKETCMIGVSHLWYFVKVAQTKTLSF